MPMILMIAAGGICGTLLRYLCVKSLENCSTNFPYATWLVNIAGSFIAGFCYVWLEDRLPEYKEYFPVLFIGFLGAFTTFSSFALECAKFMESAQYSKLCIYILLQNFSGIGAAAAGLLAAKLLLKNLTAA